VSLLFIDSFDHYATADLTEKWTATGATGGGTVAIGSGNGRHSSHGLRVGQTNVGSAETFYVQKVLAPSDATVILGVAVLVPTATVGSLGRMPIAFVRDGSTTQISLNLNSDFTLTVMRGPHDAGTALGTTTAPIPAGSFTYVELQVLIHPSAGTVAVRINGAAVLSLTGQNTRASGTSTWTSIGLGVFDSVINTTSSTTTTIDYDDLYVLDGAGAAPLNGFLGDCRIDVRFPTGAGATTGWTPNTGANWAAVDDAAPDDDTTYTSAPAAGVTDTFVVQDAPVAGAAIYGVQHCVSAKKTDSGAATIAPVIRHGGTDYPGADQSPSTAYTVLLQIAALNPGTAAAWTEAGFNAAEFGYRRTL
jgi:hypothetical protein